MDSRHLALLGLALPGALAAYCDVDPRVVGPAPTGFERFVTGAVCDLEPTAVNQDQDLTGDFTFAPSESYDDPNLDEVTPSYDVKYTINGLSDGDHLYHVHNSGDTYSKDTAIAQTNHFIGQTNQRPAGGPQEVGLLRGGEPVNSLENGSEGGYTDKIMELNRANSILGRGMVIHESQDYKRSAQCVIGMTAENKGILVSPGPLVATATCHVKGTSAAPTVEGMVDLFVDKFNSLEAHVQIYNLPQATYKLQVREWGDVREADGSSTGTAFESIVDGNQQNPIEATLVSNSNEVALTQFTESTGLLNGFNSIAGRSLVVLSQDVVPVVLAQCVIGITDQMLPTPHYPVYEAAAGTVPTVGTAVARMSGSAGVHGRVEFNQLIKGHGSGMGVEVRYTIAGLTPGSHAIRINTRGNVANVGNTGAQFTGFNSATPATAGTVGKLTSKPIGASTAAPTEIIADAQGIAIGSFLADDIRLNSYNSVVGRSVVIHSTDDLSAVEAYGAIGVRHYVAALSDPGPVTDTAHCQLLSPETGADSAPLGTITFTANGANVDLAWTGIPAGRISVNDAYDTFSTTPGVSTVFRGTAGSARSTCPVSNIFLGVGLLNNGAPVTTTGTASDGSISLNGADSVVGRPVYVVDGSDAILASCVIGRDTETVAAPSDAQVFVNVPPPTTRAPTVNLAPTRNGKGPGVSGATQTTSGFACLVVALVAALF